MTDKQWLKLGNELLIYGGNVSNNTRRNFISLLRNNPTALTQARALFGERGLYYATERDINNFVNNIYFGKNRKIEKDYRKLSASTKTKKQI